MWDGFNPYQVFFVLYGLRGGGVYHPPHGFAITVKLWSVIHVSSPNFQGQLIKIRPITLMI